MKRVLIRAAMFFLFVLWQTPTIEASWAYVPVEKFVLDADLIVVGKLDDVKAEDGTGTVKVSEVLKGDEKVKEAEIQFSAVKPGGPMHSAMIVFKQGDERIWICSQKHDNGRYWFTHPMQTTEKNAGNEIKGALKKIKELAWTTDKDSGLSAGILVSDPQPGSGFSMAYLLFRNDSKNAIHLCADNAIPLLSIKLTNPNGDSKDIDLYGEMEEPKLCKDHFKKLEAGAVKTLIFSNGFALNDLNAAGKWKLELSYTGKDGAEFKLENVFSKTLGTSAEFSVKAE